ncbi:MAG: DUF2975 domain-containing protein [Tabrizicola sp.]|nr:DUF2975 domain-containing protein [Tabrizicola sp.]
MSDLSRIERLSNLTYWATVVLTYVLPLLVFVTVLRGWLRPETILQAYPQIAPQTEVSALQASLAAIVALVAVLPLIGAFLAMTSLFSRYRRGEILSDGCAEDILRIGRAMLFLAAATLLVPTIQLLILSWSSPPGHRILQLGIDSGTLGFLMSAGLLFLIGWVMREAARIKAENEGFV